MAPHLGRAGPSRKPKLAPLTWHLPERRLTQAMAAILFVAPADLGETVLAPGGHES
jgi:hypothetical protein